MTLGGSSGDAVPELADVLRSIIDGSGSLPSNHGRINHGHDVARDQGKRRPFETDRRDASLLGR
jgi:hypothetical protein